MQVAPAEIRGTAFGLPATVRASGNVAASAIPGLLYTVASPIVAFIYLVARMLVALAPLAWSARTRTAWSSRTNDRRIFARAQRTPGLVRHLVDLVRLDRAAARGQPSTHTCTHLVQLCPRAVVW